jgi:hypothetical protein
MPEGPTDWVRPVIPSALRGTAAGPTGSVRSSDRGSSNGSANGSTASVTGPLGAVGWQRSYDRASVERFNAEIEAERVRLEAAIAEAERRIEVARRRDEQRGRLDESALSELVMASKAELDRIESEQRNAVSAIRTAAEAEAARYLELARLEAAVEAPVAMTGGDRGLVGTPEWMIGQLGREARGSSGSDR